MSIFWEHNHLRDKRTHLRRNFGARLNWRFTLMTLLNLALWAGIYYGIKAIF